MRASELPFSVVSETIYVELCPSSSRVPIFLCKLSCQQTKVLKGIVVAHITAANEVPKCLTSDGKVEGNDKRKDEVLDRAEHQWAWNLLQKYEHIFAQNDIDLGKTSHVKASSQVKW